MRISISSARRIARTGRPVASLSSPTSLRSFASSSSPNSHIGSLPIPYPATVTLVGNLPLPSSATSSGPGGASTRLQVQGPLGQLSVEIKPFVLVTHVPPPSHPSQPLSPSLASRQLSVSVANSSVKHQRAIWGLTRSLIANAVAGVSTGYTLSLRLVGVGYRAILEHAPTPLLPTTLTTSSPRSTQRLNLKLGYAHPVIIDLPSDVVASTPSTTAIVLSGIDKQRLGEVAARIRNWRVPEPYNVRFRFIRSWIRWS